MEPFETFEHKGLTIELHQDDAAGDPFEEFDQLGELVWADREYAYKNVGGKVTLDYEHYIDSDRFVSTAHMRRYLTLMERYLVAVPFRLIDYGSGGTQARIVDEDYDKSHVSGFLVVSEARRELTGAPLEGLEANAMNDWKQWQAWVQGEVYGFIVQAGADSESCWGFYEGSDLSWIRQEAREAADAIAEERARVRALPWLPTFGNPIQKAGTR